MVKWMKWLYQKVKNLSLSLLPIVLCDWVINGSEEMGNMILHNQKQNIYFLMVKKNCTYQKVTPHPHPLLGVENNHSKWPTIKLSCFLYQSPLPFFFFSFFNLNYFFLQTFSPFDFEFVVWRSKWLNTEVSLKT